MNIQPQAFAHVFQHPQPKHASKASVNNTAIMDALWATSCPSWRVQRLDSPALLPSLPFLHPSFLVSFPQIHSLSDPPSFPHPLPSQWYLPRLPGKQSMRWANTSLRQRQTGSSRHRKIEDKAPHAQLCLQKKKSSTATNLWCTGVLVWGVLDEMPDTAFGLRNKHSTWVSWIQSFCGFFSLKWFVPCPAALIETTMDVCERLPICQPAWGMPCTVLPVS